MNVHEYCPGNGTLYEVGLCATSNSKLLFLWLNPVVGPAVCVDITGCSAITWWWLRGRLNPGTLQTDLAALLGWLNIVNDINVVLPPQYDAFGKFGV